MERHPDHNVVGEEMLVIPEQIEMIVLNAIREFLKGAFYANAWKDDCVHLEALLHDTKWYLNGLDTGGIPVPRFLADGFKVPVRPGAY